MRQLFILFIFLHQPFFLHCWGWGQEARTSPAPANCVSNARDIKLTIKEYGSKLNSKVGNLESKINRILEFVEQLYSGEALLEQKYSNSSDERNSSATTPPCPVVEEKPCICSNSSTDQPLQAALSTDIAEETDEKYNDLYSNNRNHRSSYTYNHERERDPTTTTTTTSTTTTSTPPVITTTESKKEELMNKNVTEEDENKIEDINITSPCKSKKPKEGDPERGECIAQVVKPHDTIGMFYMTSYRHGHCSNRHPLSFSIRFCLGYCSSSSYIDRAAGRWTQTTKCNNCQPVELQKVRIPLACDDGFSFQKDFNNVVSCSCKRCGEEIKFE